MRIILLLALPLLVTACQQTELPAGTATSATPIPPAELAGTYRVAAVGGDPINQPEPITATLTASRIDVQSSCIRFAFDYRLDGGVLATTTAPVPSCRRALTSAEQAVQQSLAEATQVARTAGDGLAFTGNGRSVTLSVQ